MDVGSRAMTGGPTSPTGRPGTAGSPYKRKRSGVELESSPGSGGENEEDEESRRRQPGVKRACNECRQQKLRCDVVQDPFTTCSRCNRLKLECKIESNFKRVGKRSKHAEMEKQIEQLQRNLQRATAQGYIVDDELDLKSPVVNGAFSAGNQSYMGSDEAVSSLLHLKQGGSYNRPRYVREIETVGLTEDTINQLFNEFWLYYHPYIPFLSTSITADEYYQQHPLLFWVIITVASRRYMTDPGLLTSLSGPVTRLLWTTVGEVPQSHYVVKALALLCTWPLPTSTTSQDPTHILCGVMMKTATGIGLHRPNNTQDFSRVSIELNREQLHDRVVTWAVCNIVAQSIGTGYGQPASTLYDWTLAIRPGDDGPFTLSHELEARLQIERFCDKVSKEMYSNASDPRGVAGDEIRSMLTRVYRRDFSELQASIMSRKDISPVVKLHLKAAGLHLRLSAFFDSSTTQGYIDDLMSLWRATVAFLDVVFDPDTFNGGSPDGGIIRYGSNYIMQMVVAGSVVLLKLLSSFFAQEIEFDRGRQLFHRAIAAIRGMSVINNDLPWRLAEMIVQMWNGARVEQRSQMQKLTTNNPNGSHETRSAIDDSLQLKVRCRMSMSLVFDCVWTWREEFQLRGLSNLDANTKKPTKLDSAAESSSSSTTNIAPPNGSNNPSTHLESTLLPPTSQQITSGLMSVVSGNGRGLTPGTNIMAGLGGYAGESNYEVFDPLNWMLDGLVDFPYSGYTTGLQLETNGMN